MEENFDVNKELEKLGDKYFMTEFDLVNPTTNPVTYNLFDVNTLTPFQTTISNPVPPNLLGSSLSFTSVSLSEMAFCPVNNTFYIPDFITGNVYVVDANNNLVSTISFTGSQAFGIAYCPVNNSMYVGLNGVVGIGVIDCSNNSITTIINTLGFAVNQVVYNSNLNVMYVGTATNGIFVVNCFNNAIITTISTIANIYGMAYNSNNNTLYAADFSGSILTINCQTNTVFGSPIVVGTQPVDVVYNNLSNVIYVSDDLTSIIYVIDCNTNTVISTINLGVVSGVDGLVYIPSYDYLYASCRDTGQVFIINGTTNTVIGSPISVGGTPFGIGYNNANNSVYISNSTQNTSTIIPPTPVTPYFIGSFNYNQFLQDIQDNPVLVKCVMLYSSNQNNINQSFTTTVNNANGLLASVPRYPALSIPTSQLQASVAKVCFGEGFILDVTSYFGDVTIQALSSIKLILIQKQIKKSEYMWKDNCILEFKPNQIQFVKGSDAYNNIQFYPIKTEVGNTKPTISVKPSVKPSEIPTQSPVDIKPPIKPIISEVIPSRPIKF